MDVQIACHCPGEHDKDTVTLRDRLGFRDALIVSKAAELVPAGPTRAAEVLAALSEFYLLYGIEAWSLSDTGRKPLPVTRDAIRGVLFEHPDVGVVIDAADAQYGEQVLLPLIQRASDSSQPLPTDEPTSPMPSGLDRTTPEHSKPSLISTTPTDDIETTSSPPDGAYSSSQSLELAG